MPPMRAASVRFMPSSTAANESRRRLWLDHSPLASFGLLAAQSPLFKHCSCWSQHLVTGEGSNLTDPHTRPVTEKQGEPVPVCVPSPCYDSQSSLQFLLSDNFRLRHSPNPSFDKRNITFAGFCWATGNGGAGGVLTGSVTPKPKIFEFQLCSGVM